MREPPTEIGTGAIAVPPPARCLVVTAPRGWATVALRQGLERRGLAVTVVSGEVAAMIELARAATAVVVLCEPLRLGRANELMRAIVRYYPKTPCWQWDPARAPGGNQLARIDPEAIRWWTPGIPAPGSPAPGSPVTPAPGSLGTPETPGSPGIAGSVIPTGAATGAARPEPPLLTAEELEMLLGPVPGPAAAPDEGPEWDVGD
jgi:hypothetical protein